MKKSGIYIHIPFCVAKCIYCDFYSVADQENRIEEFVSALASEVERSDTNTTHWEFDTIFIGGGTPSLLTTKQLERIISALQNKFDLNNIIEFTLEANPGEAPLNKLHEFRSLGVNRLSLGVQSFKPNLLKFLSRIHTAEEARNTFYNARKAGFSNINCDLIYNIPKQTISDWKDDLNHLIKLDPEHISAYSLTVEGGTKLYDLVSSNLIKMPKDERHLEFNSLALNILSQNNYFKYEISNYSKIDKECLHNLHYWENDTYLGFGPSAHSFDGQQRWNNYSNLDRYISAVANRKSPIETYDKLNEIDKANEIIGFGLRLTKGFDLKNIPNDKDILFRKQLKTVKAKYPDMIIEENTRIRLNQNGMQFADAIAVDLMIF